MTSPNALTPEQISDLDRRHVFHSWSAQAKINPMVVTRTEGSRLWDGEDNEYLDFTGQLVYTNIGHQHPKVVEAIKAQADTLLTIAPSHANDKRAQLAQLISGLLADDMNKVFFTNGGTEANEHAVRLARQVTGRRKLLAAYRSYHGATAQSIHLTGEQRRFANDKGSSEVVHFFGPFEYRSEFYSENEQQECERALAHLERTIEAEGPESFAALIMEPIVGSAGLIPPPAGYLKGLKEILDRHGILFIADEVMSGFGRAGEWFAHLSEDVRPDLVTFAKGVNSGYVPLGGVVMSDAIAAHFDETPYPGGLTYSGHPLACAAGVATIETMREEGIVENAKRVGEGALGQGLAKLGEKYDIVGDVRGRGVFWGLDLVKDPQTKEPNPEAAAAVGAKAKANGLLVLPTANRLHIVPPCNVNDDDIAKALEILDGALSEVSA